jgi:hypothetical protein
MRENEWVWNYAPQRWEYHRPDLGEDWTINRSKVAKPDKPPYNLSLNGEHMRRGTLEELKAWVERKYTTAHE